MLYSEYYMENEAQPSIPRFQSAPSPATPSKNWSKIIMFILIGLIIIAGSVFTGIRIGKNQLAKQQLIIEQPTIYPTQTVIIPTIVLPTETSPTTDPTVDWKTYQLSQLNLDFRMPLNLNPSEKLSFTTSHANLYWNDSPNSSVKLFATSLKSTFEGGFSYLNGCVGYKESGTGYKFLTYTKAEIDMPIELTKETINQNKIKYLVVKSDPNKIIEGMPPIGITEKGYVGAIINTNNTEFPALVIQMKLSEVNTETVFNQILSTFKFTN